ncbi:MAG TPA: hypothetical protein VGM29_06435, partial [Polyangiaceae bacterium]
QDYARTASLQHDAKHAAALYRTLASRAGLLDELPRSVVYIEAAAHVLVADRAGAEEALAYLGQVAEGGAGQGLSDWVLAESALCMDRADHADRARLAFAGRAPALLVASASAPLLPPGELAALNAVALEATARAGAREQWEAFLNQAASDNPWLEHARKKRAELAVPRKVKS